ncbi:hypothetical protein BaRGS_00007854 [Batillaria attramentaria]|uniref:Uncharacterized protein n=1 Tax=Batillaria attramentaria TaxID=370345 RepID=A0ABD0LMY6_9CAEN
MNILRDKEIARERRETGSGLCRVAILTLILRLRSALNEGRIRESRTQANIDFSVERKTGTTDIISEPLIHSSHGNVEWSGPDPCNGRVHLRDRISPLDPRPQTVAPGTLLVLTLSARGLRSQCTNF